MEDIIQNEKLDSSKSFFTKCLSWDRCYCGQFTISTNVKII